MVHTEACVDRVTHACLSSITTYLPYAGFMLICLGIDFVQSYPKILSLMSFDPKGSDVDGSASSRPMEDEDVVAEAARVELLNHRATPEAGEVVLKGLRKVYRTSEVRRVCRAGFDAAT